MIGLRRVMHDIMVFWQHTRSKDVGHGDAIIAFEIHIQSNDVGRDMPLLTLQSIRNKTMTGMACYHRRW